MLPPNVPKSSHEKSSERMRERIFECRNIPIILSPNLSILPKMDGLLLIRMKNPQ